MEDMFPTSDETQKGTSILSGKNPPTARGSQWEEATLSPGKIASFTQGVIEVAKNLVFGEQGPQQDEVAQITSPKQQDEDSENLRELLCFHLSSKIDPSSSQLLKDKWEALEIAGERLGSSSSTVFISNIEDLERELVKADASSRAIAIPYEDDLVFPVSFSSDFEYITYYDLKTKKLCTKEKTAFRTAWIDNKWVKDEKSCYEDLIICRKALIIKQEKQSKAEINDWEDIEISSQEMLVSRLEIALASTPPDGPLSEKWMKLKAADNEATCLGKGMPTFEDLQKELSIGEDSSSVIVIPYGDRLVFACSISQDCSKISYYDPKERKQICMDTPLFEKSWKENTWLTSSDLVENKKLGRSVLIIRTELAKKTSRRFPPSKRGWQEAIDAICAGQTVHKPSIKLQEQYKMAIEEARIATREEKFIDAWDQSADYHRREGYQSDFMTIKNLADIQRGLCSTEDSPSCILIPFTPSWIVVCSVSQRNQKVLYLIPEEWGMCLVEEKNSTFLKHLASARKTIPEEYRFWARRLVAPPPE